MITSLLLVVACFVSQAATFASQSGEMQLEVEQMGDGTSWLTLRDSKGQSRSWNRTLPHSVRGVHVCEDGSVVAQGIEGPKDNWAKQSFALTILDPQGKTLLLELHPFQAALSHVGKRPDVEGLLVWEAADTCAFQIDDVGTPDQLWTYRLSTGMRCGVIEPEVALAQCAEQEGDAILQDARPLSGTDLFLATFRFTKFEGSPPSMVAHELCGAAALMDIRGELLWWKLMERGQFLGALREVATSRDDHRWEIDIMQAAEGVQRWPKRPEKECVGLMPLRIQRDADGAWRVR